MVLLTVGHQKAGPSVLAPLPLASRGGPLSPMLADSPVREVLEEDLDLLSTPDTFEAVEDLIAMMAQSSVSYSCALA